MLPALLAAFAFTLGPELPSSTPITQPGHTAWDPVIASDGRDFLVEWHDSRGGPRIAKVSSDGTVTPTSGTPFPYYGPLAWNGSNYVLLWVNSGVVEVTRFDRDGTVLDAVPKKGATIPNNVIVRMVSGSRMLIISADPVDDGKQQAYVLGSEGDLIRSVSLPPRSHVVAEGSNGKEFLILSSDFGGTLLVTRLSREGALLDAAPVTIGNINDAELFSIQSDGDGYLVMGVTEGLGNPPNIAHAMALSAAGVPRGGVTTIALPDGFSINRWDMVWSGSAYLFACTGTGPAGVNRSAVWRATVGRDANVLTAPSEVVTEGMDEIALASNGSAALHVWAASPPGQSCCSLMTLGVMSAQLLDAAGATRGAPFPVTNSAPPQRHQEVAWSGQGFLAVWSEATGLFMGRLNAGGNPIEGRGVQITNKNAASLNFGVAFDGRAFIVTWNELSTIFALRVRPDGTIDGYPMIVSESSAYYPTVPTLTCDGRGGCLVTWADGYTLRGRLLRDGVPFTSSQRLADIGFSDGISVVFNGRDYMVAFTTDIAAPPSDTPRCLPQPIGSNVRLFRVSSAGMLIDPVPVVLTLGTKQPPIDRQPTMAWGDGDTGLLVWENGALSAVAIDRDFHLTSAVYAIGTQYASNVHVAFDGEAYLVTSLDTYGSDYNRLRLTIVSPKARPGESLVVESAGTPGSVTRAGTGHALITYVRPSNGGPALDGVSRAFCRMVNDLGDLPVRQPAVRH